MRNYLICLLAVIGLHAERVFGQALGGTVVRLSPTVLPGICHVGDIRVDQANNFALSICTASGTWVVVSGSQPNPTTTLGDMIYNNGVGQARLPGNQSAFMTVLTQTGVGTASASPAWTNALTGMTISGVFSGPLTGTASFATLAGSVTSASQAGTASFAVLAGTASAATAFTATPTACAAGVWANAIGPNGNLTCAIVSTASTSGTAAFASSSSTASTSGTAAFAAVSGTASAATAFTSTPTACGANQYAGAIGPNGNLTCSTVTTASQAGTAAFVSSFSGLISPGQGGTGITTWTTNAIILGGNGTAAFSSVGTGAASTYLKMSSGAPVWATFTSHQQFVFTSGSAAIYTPSATLKAAWVRCIAGGGGGGGAATASSGAGAGGGGGGGAYFEKFFLPSGNCTYTIGAAGGAAPAGNNSGTAGGSTTFNCPSAVNMTAAGGSPGGGGAGAQTSGAIQGGSGAGGAATGGADLNAAGSPGWNGHIFTSSQVEGGFGGPSIFGGGGGGAVNGAAGGNAAGFGSGGGGGSVPNVGVARGGGLGTQGLCIIDEFFNGN